MIAPELPVHDVMTVTIANSRGRLFSAGCIERQIVAALCLVLTLVLLLFLV